MGRYARGEADDMYEDDDASLDCWQYEVNAYNVVYQQTIQERNSYELGSTFVKFEDEDEMVLEIEHYNDVPNNNKVMKQLGLVVE